MRAIFKRNFGAKSYTKPAFGFEILAPKILYKNVHKKTLMKLTPGTDAIKKCTPCLGIPF
jgi:hypothetical protein